MHRQISAAFGALALTFAPIAANAQEVGIDRTAPATQGESELGGNSTLLLVLGAAAVAVAIFLIADGDDDDAISA